MKPGTARTSAIAIGGDSTEDGDEAQERSASDSLGNSNHQDDGDDQKSSSSPSSTGTHSYTTSRNGTTATGGLIHNVIDKRIGGARGVLLLFLFGAAAALGISAYFATTDEEENSFQANFVNSATEVIDASNKNVHKVFAALEGLSVTTTGFIVQQHRKNNGQYPPAFVTVPEVERHLGNAREASGAYVVGYLPTVEGSDYDLWREYSELNKGWMVDAYKVNPTGDLQGSGEATEDEDDVLIIPYIWDYLMRDEDGKEISFDSSTCGTKDQVIPKSIEHIPEDPGDGPASPIWLLSPPPNPTKESRENFNMRSDPVFEEAVRTVQKYRTSTFHDICSTTKWFDPTAYPEKVDTIVVVPVFGGFEENAAIVGHYFAIIPWVFYFQDELVTGTDPVHAVVESSCGHTFAFVIEGHSAAFLEEDYDAAKYGYFEEVVSAPFAEFAHDSCLYTLSVYPTASYVDTYSSKDPLYYMLFIFGVFILTTAAFLVFDRLQRRRQASLIKNTTKQHALVASLFPKSIQNQLLEDIDNDGKWNKSGMAGLRSFLKEGGNSTVGGSAGNTSISGEGTSKSSQWQDNPGGGKSKPIADLFPDVTIMFADICGFTAWSSTREPCQVFTLLETIYHEFDQLCTRRRVFKVEVVGDCYVAVSGLPDPRKDHAVVMARFANDCLTKMYQLTRTLEVELGPDTAELGLRIGLHSGPVVAGVLRGDRSRFQLFGDTMNTASRLESTGVMGKIQMSQETTDLLIKAGKHAWIVQRPQKVQAKGKGELTTYFLTMPTKGGIVGTGVGTVGDHGSIVSSSESCCLTESFDGIGHNHPSAGMVYEDMVAVEERKSRIAEWTVAILSRILCEVIAGRISRNEQPDPILQMIQLEQASLRHEQDRTVIDEVAKVIVLPAYSTTNNNKAPSPNIELDEIVQLELLGYVQTVAALYNPNPFHNFDHANHVVMSVNKLLSRINAPDLDNATAQNLHDHTYGITSDPLTWFAVVFAALIHDIDHSGVPNTQLLKEQTPSAMLYKGKSIAEQNSFDIAWDLLLEPSFSNLRRTIYTTQVEFHRFRQLVVNTVMATDIIDKDLKKLQQARWEDAFAAAVDDEDGDIATTTTAAATAAGGGTGFGVGSSLLYGSTQTRKQNRYNQPQQKQTGTTTTAVSAKDLKATIVIEHLIQASDVSHTMQHWHIYRRWNERYFRECYVAYREGRSTTNPADTWYQGELGFFDFYIIPLAKKLKECGVFGVCSDEYLSYAVQNRHEWEERGQDIVKMMIESIKGTGTGTKTTM